jgi:hypothetical protein
MIKNRKRVLVRIINPIDKRTHTTMRAAADMVQRGIAVYEAGVGLRFVDDRPLRLSIQEQQAENIRKMDESILAGSPGGAIWWNGCNESYQQTGKQFYRLPFTAPSIQPPDQYARFRRASQLA